jgi:malonate transporter and related proteins
MDALINVVVPVFGVVLTGYLAGRFEVLGSDSAAALNRFVFYFALPPALFIFMARAPVEKIFNWPFIGAFVGGELGTFLIALVVGRFLLGQDVATRAVAGLTAAQANTVYMGLPLLLTAYGPDGALPTIVATLCLTFLFITGVIAVLEGTRASEQSAFRMAAQLSGRVLRNPLVISPLLGILFSTAALPLPKAASNYLDLMAATVGPAALFSLGLSLVDRKLTGNMGEVIWLTTLKAIFNPLLTFALVTYVFAMDPFWSKAAVILSAMPTGANAYVIAQQYNVHVETVSSVVVVSTGASVVTISLLLIWLGVG